MAQKNFNEYCACRACKVEISNFFNSIGLDADKIETIFAALKQIPDAKVFFDKMAADCPLFIEGEDYEKLDPTTLSPVMQNLFGSWKSSFDALKASEKEMPKKKPEDQPAALPVLNLIR